MFRLRINNFNKYINCDFKNRSRTILRLWGDHCEYIIAQRIRRAQQMFFLYHRIRDEHKFRFFITHFRKQVKPLIWLFSFFHNNVSQNFAFRMNLRNVSIIVHNCVAMNW